MNKVTVLWGMIAVLLAANLLLAAALYGRKPPRHEGPRKLIIEKLHFDDSQIARYDTLVGAHRKAIEQKQRDMVRLKNELYAGLKNEQDSDNFLPQADSTLQQIKATQIAIERIHYAHFRDIKRLCRAEQLPYFDQLSAEIARLFAPPLARKH